MKHLLNNLTEQEKNSIREQHTGGMEVVTKHFSRLMNGKSGDSKPLIKKPTLLLLSVFVVSTCGLIYELVAGTLASYVLGDSVMQFSTIIGLYLFSMGVGSYLSRYFNNNLLAWFIRIEIMIAIVGGFSPTALFVLFEQVYYFRLVLYSLVFLTGVFVGLEIPLLMRILKDEFSFSDLVSEIFTFDYIGALLASLVFPLFFVPQLGLIRTALVFGLLWFGFGLALVWLWFWLLFFFGLALD